MRHEWDINRFIANPTTKHDINPLQLQDIGNRLGHAKSEFC